MTEVEDNLGSSGTAERLVDQQLEKHWSAAALGLKRQPMMLSKSLQPRTEARTDLLLALLMIPSLPRLAVI